MNQPEYKNFNEPLLWRYSFREGDSYDFQAQSESQFTPNARRGQDASGVVGIISHKSGVNFYNSDIRAGSEKGVPVFGLDSSIFLDSRSSLGGRTSYISDNTSIIDLTRRAGAYRRHVAGNRCMYSMETPHYAKQYKTADSNTVLFPIFPYICKPLATDGGRLFFADFHDGVLLDDIQFTVSRQSSYDSIQVRNSSGMTCQLNIPVDQIISNLPSDLNGHTVVFNIEDSCVSDRMIFLKNTTGGSVVFRIDSADFSLVCINCSNIEIYGLNGNGIVNSPWYFRDCFGVKLDGIRMERGGQALPSQYTGEYTNNGMLYFKNSDAVVSNVNFSNGNAGASRTAVPIIADAARVMLHRCEFSNISSKTQIHNFAMVDDDGMDLKSMQEYYDGAVLSGQAMLQDGINGLYKHCHPSYMPYSGSLPFGIMVEYPVTVNMRDYWNLFGNNQAHQLYDNPELSSIYLVETMRYGLPDCLLPFNTDDEAKWIQKYSEKYNRVKQLFNDGGDIKLKPFNTLSGQFICILHNGFVPSGNIPEQQRYIRRMNTDGSTNQNYMNMFEIIPDEKQPYNKDICFFNRNGKTYNFKLYSIVKLVADKQRFCRNEKTKYFFNSVVGEKSFIQLTLKNKKGKTEKFKLSFNQIYSYYENKEFGKNSLQLLFKNYLDPENENGITDSDNIVLKLNQDISRWKNYSPGNNPIQIYYFGIPTDKNWTSFGGEYMNTSWSGNRGQKFTDDGDKKMKIRFDKYIRAYFTFYSGVMQCMYVGGSNEVRPRQD